MRKLNAMGVRSKTGLKSLLLDNNRSREEIDYNNRRICLETFNDAVNDRLPSTGTYVDVAIAEYRRSSATADEDKIESKSNNNLKNPDTDDSEPKDRISDNVRISVNSIESERNNNLNNSGANDSELNYQISDIV